MLTTEAEAKTKWCPHARVIVGRILSQDTHTITNPQSPHNRVSFGAGGQATPGGSHCLGSGCMFWRWAGWLNRSSGCVASHCPEEDRDGDRLGYCGAAGRPE
jgi:hypothetical protein